MADNYFIELNQINLNDVKEKKNNLDYISWAWAWQKVKELHPTTSRKVYENEDGWNYFTDGNTCWVKVGVTINGIEEIEYLPVMDYRNNSIPLTKVTSMDVNKAIQRCTVKAIARHGLGLYVYAGEDLPSSEDAEPVAPKIIPPTPTEPPQPQEPEWKILYSKLLEICPDEQRVREACKANGCKSAKSLNAFFYNAIKRVLENDTETSDQEG